MRIISLSTLKAYWTNDPAGAGAKEAALAWYRHTLKADWALVAPDWRGFGRSEWPHSPFFASRLAAIGGWIGAPMVVVLCIISASHAEPRWLSDSRYVLEDIFWALFFVWLIDRAAKRFGGVAGRILELRPIVYLGKISYGLYVIHLFMILGVPWLFQRLRIPYPNALGLQFGLFVLATFILAALSWKLYERPLNDLKRLVPYT